MEEEHVRSTTKPTASKSEVISSAKVIIDAAKSAFANDNEKIDKAQVAEAAADLLEATNHYGKLEDKSYGKIINKAEEYLHNCNGGAKSDHHDVHGHGHASHASGDGEHGTGSHENVKKEEMHHGGGGGSGGHGHNEHSHGGGYGEYVKMAQGFVNKHDNTSDSEGGHGHSNSGGGYGDYVKIAQGILKK